MQRSESVEHAVLQFYNRVSESDVASFDLLVSRDDATSIIGTAPGEWVRDPAALRLGFETEGLRLTPGSPEAYEEGSIGWAIDEPLMGFPDGGTIRIRLTMVFRQENDGWKLLHAHFSVGVPDEEVAELQAKWSG